MYESSGYPAAGYQRDPYRGDYRGNGPGASPSGRQPYGARPAQGPPGYGDHPQRPPQGRHPQGRPPQGRRPKRGRRRLGKILLAMGITVAAVVTGAGLLEYQKLNGNIRSVPLFAGLGGNAGTEKVDPFGHSPINILVIGSDARNGAANCALGHDCKSGGTNADVELLVHVAADRSNATVLSIPRDTITQLPACRNPKTGRVSAARAGMINSSLADGPGCTVAAVHQLTGVPIDHFAMVDFAGVVAMSDAAGGVPVCVTDNVYDPYSHLKLTAGTHTLKGVAALQFVRSRHGFGDGSDLGRTYAQHLFLASMLRTLRSTGTVTNPAALLDLAQAATQAVTVDTGLASIASLVGLAQDVAKVPAKRITFATMPTSPDPANKNRVVPAGTAADLFEAVANDVALTKGAARTTGTTGTAGLAGMPDGTAASPAPATTDGEADMVADAAGIAVRVLNGTGLNGRAAGVASGLVKLGFSPGTSTGTTGLVARTTLRYPKGRQMQAETVAGALHLPTGSVSVGTGPSIVLTIGQDWTTGPIFGGAAAGIGTAGTGTTGTGTTGTTGRAVAGTATPPAGAHASTADNAKACAMVSKQATVALKGVGMSPIQAFRRSPEIPLSAP